MTKKKRAILYFLGITVLLVVIVAPFSASEPDGLEWVADRQGFSQKAKAEGKHAWLREYQIPGVKNATLGTILSGLMGIVLVFGLTYALGKMYKKSKASHS